MCDDETRTAEDDSVLGKYNSLTAEVKADVVYAEVANRTDIGPIFILEEASATEMRSEEMDEKPSVASSIPENLANEDDSISNVLDVDSDAGDANFDSEKADVDKEVIDDSIDLDLAAAVKVAISNVGEGWLDTDTSKLEDDASSEEFESIAESFGKMFDMDALVGDVLITLDSAVVRNVSISDVHERWLDADIFKLEDDASCNEIKSGVESFG